MKRKTLKIKKMLQAGPSGDFPKTSFKFQANNGQLLIESFIGISIVVVGLLGIVGLVSRSLSLNRVVSDQFTASYLSLEGIEIARNLLDSNIIKINVPWNEGFDNENPDISYEAHYRSELLDISQDRFLKINDDGFYGYDSGKETPFVRTIKVINNENEVIVNSIVEWSSRGGKYKIDNEHRFYDWRP